MANMTRVLMVGSFLVTSAGLSACANMGTIPSWGCSEMQLSPAPVVSERIEFDTFSVKSPQFGTWCQSPKTNQTLAYTSLPMFGHEITSSLDRDFLRNSLVLMVRYVRTLKSPLNDVDQLQSFHQRWMKAGGITTVSAGQAWANFVSLDRFRVLSYSATPNLPIAGKCIQYESLVEERNNPAAPGKILHLHGVGVVCLDQIRKGRLILAVLSERYIQGKQFRPKLFAQLRDKTAKPFFASLRLKK